MIGFRRRMNSDYENERMKLWRLANGKQSFVSKKAEIFHLALGVTPAQMFSIRSSLIILIRMKASFHYNQETHYPLS